MTSTTFSSISVIRATIHSRVFICSAMTPVALRKWWGKETLNAAQTGTAEFRVGRNNARSPFVKLRGTETHQRYARSQIQAKVTHLRNAILSTDAEAARWARSRYALASLIHFRTPCDRASAFSSTPVRSEA